MNTEMIAKGDNENFDVQQLININGQIAMNIHGLSKQMGIMAGTVDGLRTDVGHLQSRMDILELKETFYSYINT